MRCRNICSTIDAHVVLVIMPKVTIYYKKLGEERTRTLIEWSGKIQLGSYIQEANTHDPSGIQLTNNHYNLAKYNIAQQLLLVTN